MQQPPPSEITSKASSEAPASLRYKSFISKNADVNPRTLVLGSPQHYLCLTDSLQRTFSRKVYYDNLQTIIDQISETPDDKRSPAVNTDNWYAAIDFNIRKPHFIILHHTAQSSVEQALFTFSVRKKSETSTHYVISRDGKVYQMLNDYIRSYHAGAGKWGNVSDMNSCSLGIEIDNDGEKDQFTSVQMNALIKLLAYLKQKYSVPTGNIIGHSDFAPVRKNDPSVLFPWSQLASAGFGYWYDISNLKQPPPNFNPLLALRVIGYDISVPENAIIGFKHHFIQNNASKILNDYEKKIIYNIMLKYE
ncbi:N-acetylmuramoyl-L-alanine amidase [Niabella drilacis]|uniref:N-acetylmuramoyl-L-alanine amidase n=1 Tax=Niabella drilacis (strain DSM 25811 / CCM 8410 / CCUG 62505 / LMG 26954 / E90) TaxID=1285928 RepID=A0A1G6ZJU7_NIADE|nr:N-acetylmuramoyl-L-alanine amidase [Niabella drilacis]SDE02898.1 N-acetylmuramoyl-L-alanine amidase [Niabella drilacis]